MKPPEIHHQSKLASRRADHESHLELFKSVLESGQTAINTAILISGGGAVALMAFVGNLPAKDPATPNLACAIILFAIGVLSGAMAAGARHFSQVFELSGCRKGEIGFYITSVVLVIAVYGLFMAGVLAAYQGFIR